MGGGGGGEKLLHKTKGFKVQCTVSTSHFLII